MVTLTGNFLILLESHSIPGKSVVIFAGYRKNKIPKRPWQQNTDLKFLVKEP